MTETRTRPRRRSGFSFQRCGWSPPSAMGFFSSRSMFLVVNVFHHLGSQVEFLPGVVAASKSTKTDKSQKGTGKAKSGTTSTAKKASGSSASPSKSPPGAADESDHITGVAARNTNKPLQPKVTWQQNSDTLFLTIHTPGCKQQAENKNYAALSATDRGKINFARMPQITDTRIQYQCDRVAAQVSSEEDFHGAGKKGKDNEVDAAATTSTAVSSSTPATTTPPPRTYSLDLKLLRKIAPASARVQVFDNKVQINVDKLAKEPCWKHLLKAGIVVEKVLTEKKKKQDKTKSKKSQNNQAPGGRVTTKIKNPPWLQFEFDQLYADDCQLQKELWRETYFKEKYKHGAEDEIRKLHKHFATDMEKLPVDQQVKFATWNAAIQKMRDRAVPYDEVKPFTISGSSGASST
ncbi:unnamed protein product [Amoebophrya sp. A120]|nr:unnamed protein product [Amoebophrya sp. A120]|eukprot:GSA120T00010565001.1